MPFCCRTCDYREHAVQTVSSTRQPLEVCLITLDFKTPVTTTNGSAYVALNTLLNNITDAPETTSRPTTFTSWSPCLSNSNIAAILTTVSKTCRNGSSQVFETILGHLSAPPNVRHVYLDYSIMSLAASSPEQRISCDIIIVQAPNPGVASVVGKRFGWDPASSALSARSGVGGPAAFSKPGDLVHDFWAWAELHPGATMSSSSSIGSGYESSDSRPALMSTNTDEKNMSLFYTEDEERTSTEDETLIMIFQWRSRVDADRFKHPLQKSYGQNGQEVSNDLWDRHVAHPVRQLEGIGAKTEMLKLELRGMEPRIDVGKAAARGRSGGRRFSTMATGFGEKVSGLWGR
ncbi:hypothetical protein BU23DRAFT_578846 [Bimuria novae-zelandiae CBS 107.79]|uniref:Uncharacterized protein n=1 Tax=Bimuria novae-zelandiae CBS 107.79 TaxID=1447943 RepID=A0A6A5VHZ1_9PLEO|nr:hypothetical protein BU23DRAFT_578846 [Bimuria novae-zelandiae CBS 107.79]